jgi:hypothetical protein
LNSHLEGKFSRSERTHAEGKEPLMRLLTKSKLKGSRVIQGSDGGDRGWEREEKYCRNKMDRIWYKIGYWVKGRVRKIENTNT